MTNLPTLPADDASLFSFAVASPEREVTPYYPTSPYCAVAIIVAYPEACDTQSGRLLDGAVGNMLRRSMRELGIDWGSCYVDFLCRDAALAPKTKAVRGRTVASPEFDRDDVVRDKLLELRPNIVLLVGDIPVTWWMGTVVKAEDWRGSLIYGPASSQLASQQALVVEDPRLIFVDWGGRYPLFAYDMEKLRRRWRSRDWVQPTHNFALYVTADDAVSMLAAITDIATPVAMDIEGHVHGVSCISFATSPRDAFIVPLNSFSGDAKRRALRAVARFLASSTPKILQNSLYDNFVLSYSYRMTIRNVVWDTMLSGWEIDPELPKGLATQTSIYTDWPYYKHLRFDPSSREFYRYCCLDSAITYEIYVRHRELMDAAALRHFEFNMSLLSPLLYMEMRGMRYNRVAADVIACSAGARMTELEALIRDELTAIWQRHGSRGLPPSEVNPASPKQLAEVLYKRLGYPPQYPKIGREVDKTRVTTSVDALLALRVTNTGPDHVVLDYFLEWRKLVKYVQGAEVSSDRDGRARCGYNVVGTDTGRLTCYESPTGSGTNLTTITKKLRLLYTADDDHWFFQCDLSGADGWTVAAWCEKLGDPTMLNDYYAKRKPAKIIALLYLMSTVIAPTLVRVRPNNDAEVAAIATTLNMPLALMQIALASGTEVSRWSDTTLNTASEFITEDGFYGWLYFACKQVQHGSNYGLGKDKMSGLILKSSYKQKGVPIVVTPFECMALQNLYMQRYPGVRRWQNRIKETVQHSRQIGCASGHVRRMHGRPTDHSTISTAWSHEPQANTTYATNLALWRLWHDPENRLRGSAPRTTRFSMTGRSFRAEPLHHVHDALCGQFRKSDTEWAVERIPTYFRNELIIADHRITIPFEGAYGPSWGELGAHYGGGEITM